MKTNDERWVRKTIPKESSNEARPNDKNEALPLDSMSMASIKVQLEERRNEIRH